MTIALAVAIVALSSYIGWKAGKKYALRPKILSDAVALCVYLKQDIQYTCEPVRELINKRSGLFCAKFEQLLQYFSENIGEEGLEAECISMIPELKTDDRQLIVQLLESLGKSDMQSQGESLDSFKTALSRLLDEAAIEKKKSAVFIRLGILTGIGLAITVL